MIRLVCVLFLAIPASLFGQSDTIPRKIYTSDVPVDLLISFAEKETSSDANSGKTYSITVTVTNIRNDKGVLRFKFFDDNTPFPDDHGFLKVIIDKSGMVGGSITRTFHGFTSKKMAIAVLDDENNNVKLDMGWFFPKEGHAFSDYYHSALRRPVYNDFTFLLTGDKVVVMKMKYY